MTRPIPPRLPELGGMTEAGFNRVVAMIQPWDFYTPHQCSRPWGWDFPLGCAKCQGLCDSYNEWRSSLPKTRNKRQRKADAKRVNFPRPFPVEHCTLCNARLAWNGYTLSGKPHCERCYKQQFVGSWAHSETPLEVLQRGVREVEAATSAPLHTGTPLQRLQQFVAETGVPVSFEIAEAAMKREF